MVLGVNLGVTVSSLTSVEVSGIYSGAITNWSEVGGSDLDIIVLDREETESSKLLLREEIFDPNLIIGDKVVLLHSSGSTNKTIESTAGAIGQTSLGVINLEQLNIKPLAINGVTPSVETIENDTYPLVRRYGLILPKGELDPSVQAFIDFITGSEAKALLQQYDFAPVVSGR